jgi:SAM-dependent methyltransferase
MRVGIERADFVRRCRSCGADGLVPFLSLGMTPLANSLVSADDLDSFDPMYPLGVAFCGGCTLVQLIYEVPAQVVFNPDYPYFSSFSDAVTDHGRTHAAELIAERGLDRSSFVVEVASNDGYHLRPFIDAGVRALGVDPAPGPAAAARAAGVPTIEEFFDVSVAKQIRDDGPGADVVIAKNVMAHVPDLNGFVAGLASLVSDDGIITIENPYVRDMIEHSEFDTIYHEHLCYFSCTAVDQLMRRHGLSLNRVDYFPELHGGTLRWTVARKPEVHESVGRFLQAESDRGIDTAGYYVDFAMQVVTVQKNLFDLLVDLHSGGASLAAYGAAAKGATLLNTARVPQELLRYVVDRNHHKHGRYIPGIRLPVRPIETLEDDRPDYLLLLAWNHADEIVEQLDWYRRAGGRFIVPVPNPRVFA